MHPLLPPLYPAPSSPLSDRLATRAMDSTYTTAGAEPPAHRGNTGDNIRSAKAAAHRGMHVPGPLHRMTSGRSASVVATPAAQGARQTSHITPQAVENFIVRQPKHKHIIYLFLDAFPFPPQSFSWSHVFIQ